MSWNRFKASNEWLVASRWNFYKNVIICSTINLKRNRTPNYSYRPRNSHIDVTAYLHRALIIPCVNFSFARCVGEFFSFPMCALPMCRPLPPNGLSHGEWRRFFLLSADVTVTSEYREKNWLRQKISEIFFFPELVRKQFLVLWELLSS